MKPLRRLRFEKQIERIQRRKALYFKTRKGNPIISEMKLKPFTEKSGEYHVVKEEKNKPVTKEEKFIPENKSISQLKKVIETISVEELMYIANKDARVTAREMAKKELARRGD